MKYGVCKLSIVPGREESSDKSEMITQLLFGDHYKIIEEKAKWTKVRVAYDKYECWICIKQTHEISKEQYEKLESQEKLAICTALTQPVKHIDSKEMLPITLGSTLPLLKKNNQFALGDDEYVFIGSTYKPSKPSREKSIDFARMFINAPYLWGGKSPFGIDCSGFVQLVYKLIGIKLPRDAYQQAEIGQTLSFVEEAQQGDLAFFDNSEGEITHVGIILNDNYILHASGKVRLDKIDHQGIFNMEKKSYSHKMRLIKSII
jgi:hypothetical protein